MTLPISEREIALVRQDEGGFIGRFNALGGPCEVLIDDDDTEKVRAAIQLVVRETLRIEQKFSRYRRDSIVYAINQAQGRPVQLDDETSALIDYADDCFRLSEGLFDITSGILRKVWRFDGQHKRPESKAIKACLPFVGWRKVKWRRPQLCLQPGMEIDLGGIGKEYAVDRATLILEHLGLAHALVNFGGDLRVTGPRRQGEAWLIGIDDPRDTGRGVVQVQGLAEGAMATSGDARRFILSGGKRYGHILDPRTGWPVPDAPHSVTVLAPSCLEAGMLATFGMLQGASAESYLSAQGVIHHVVG